MRCSEYYTFGGTIELGTATTILKASVEFCLLRALKESLPQEEIVSSSLAFLLPKLFSKLEVPDNEQLLIAPAINKFTHKILLSLNSKVYGVVTGPLPLRTQIGRHLITSTISGILKPHKTASLRIVDFTPYRDGHSVANDPMIQLKIANCRSEYRVTTIWCGYHLTESLELKESYLTERDVDKPFLGMLESQLDHIADGYHMPIIPCPHQCQFKSTCFPESAWKPKLINIPSPIKSD